jgi:hypothetical protein
LDFHEKTKENPKEQTSSGGSSGIPPSSSSSDTGVMEEPLYNFFDKSAEQYIVKYEPKFNFQGNRLYLNISRPRYSNLAEPGLRIELRKVDYSNGVKYTVFWSSVLLACQSVGLVINMISIC